MNIDAQQAVRNVPGLERALTARPESAFAVESLVAAGFGPSLAKWLGPHAAGPGVIDRFLSDLGRVDVKWLARLRDDVRASGMKQVSPLNLLPFPSSEVADVDRGAMAEAGRTALTSGRWGVVIFAGGAATRFWAGARNHPQAASVLRRFGGNAPKGLFPVCERTGRSFLDLFVEQMLASASVSGRIAPLVLMAGRATSAPLQEWVDRSLPNGFPRDMVRVMVQAEHPRLDMDGDLIVRPDGSLVFTGDGHGGVFRALLAPGDDAVTTIEWLRGHGVSDLVLHNVDNVAANALEPTRLGFHLAGGFLMTLSAVPRLDPFEKVGIVALNADSGRVEVVEYSVCPPETATATDASGALLFRPAHINSNLVSLDAVRPDLPPTLYPGKEVDVGGTLVPACSHEMLNQSLAGMLEPERVGCLVLDRREYFQPTKSLTGVDSLVTTREWLASRGID